MNSSGLVKGVDKAPEIKEEDINVMFATNVTGLINMTQRRGGGRHHQYWLHRWS
jgi:NADP-dependent 3-hydroxy acid dehydrogenase YdfG